MADQKQTRFSESPMISTPAEAGLLCPVCVYKAMSHSPFVSCQWTSSA